MKVIKKSFIFCIILIVLPLLNISSQTDKQSTLDLDPVEDIGYDAGQLQDINFSVKNITFTTYFKSNGRGEVIDVIFDIHNEKETKQELSYSVVTFYESDFVQTKERKFIPYPTWRKRDFDKEKKIVYFIKASPININKEDMDNIWKNTVDGEYQVCINAKNKTELCEFQKKQRNKIIKKYDILPPMWDLMNYIQQNPIKFAKKFTLPGISSPDKKKEFIEENGVEVGKLYHTRTMTTIMSSHESLYRPNYYFFNKVLIYLFDANTGKVLYRRLIRFKREKKIER
jgi:hypothetical protein